MPERLKGQDQTTQTGCLKRQPIERTRTRVSRIRIPYLLRAHNMCECRESLADEHADDPRACIFRFSGTYWMIIHGFRGHTHSILTFWYYYIRACVARSVDSICFALGAASGYPRSSRHRLFLRRSPLGRPPAPPSARHRRPGQGAGGNHGGTPGITHFSPAGAHGHAGAGPSATQVSRHPLMRTLYTLDSKLCHEAQRVAVASVGTMVGTRHLISLTLFGYRTAALSLRSAASQQIIAHTLCLSVHAHITARRYWFQLRERRFSLPVPPRYLGHTQAMSQKSAQSDVTCCFVAARAHTRPHLMPTANSQGR